MPALPHNIERSAFKGNAHAPYHGWDASGRFWRINPRRANGRAYRWDAYCRDSHEPLRLSADSLAALGAFLAQERARA